MISETKIFSLSGPTYLNAVDWNNANHRRCVLASVVQGVYVLEHDRQMNRVGPKSLASPWWESFHFHLVDILVDSADHSIFGVILQLNTISCCLVINSPKYVVAFRGTLIRSATLSSDVILDVQCILNDLHHSSRFHLALRSIQHTVAIAGAHNVWLTGHSLGSAIALLAGKNMAKLGYHLPTYLFSSPFTSAPLERINHQKLKQWIHIAASVMKAGLSAAIQRHQNRRYDEKEHPFSALSDWVPCLFLNPSDPICSGYIGYFEQREKMERLGAARIEKVATQHTVETLLSGALHRESEPLHLLPSAELIINLGHTPSFRAAHGIEQWWHPYLRSQSVMYRYK